jgi:AcrR family transcriptional regulator
MTALPRRITYRNEFRAAILDAARDLFVHHGYHDFSMRVLARKLECSVGTIYVYFKNKEELFDCLVEQSFAQLLDLLPALKRERDKDPVRLLKRAARAYVEFGLSHPSAYKFAFIIERPGAARAYTPHPAFNLLQRLVQRCLEAKKLRRLDVATASQALWAAVHGVTSLLILRPSFPWVNRHRLVQRVIESAVDGLIANSRANRGGGGKLVKHGGHRADRRGTSIAL